MKKKKKKCTYCTKMEQWQNSCFVGDIGKLSEILAKHSFMHFAFLIVVHRRCSKERKSFAKEVFHKFSANCFNNQLIYYKLIKIHKKCILFACSRTWEEWRHLGRTSHFWAKFTNHEYYAQKLRNVNKAVLCAILANCLKCVQNSGFCVFSVD